MKKYIEKDALSYSRAWSLYENRDKFVAKYLLGEVKKESTQQKDTKRLHSIMQNCFRSGVSFKTTSELKGLAPDSKVIELKVKSTEDEREFLKSLRRTLSLPQFSLIKEALEKGVLEQEVSQNFGNIFLRGFIDCVYNKEDFAFEFKGINIKTFKKDKLRYGIQQCLYKRILDNHSFCFVCCDTKYPYTVKKIHLEDEFITFCESQLDNIIRVYESLYSELLKRGFSKDGQVFCLERNEDEKSSLLKALYEMKFLKDHEIVVGKQWDYE